MKRIKYRILSKKLVAIVLVSAMTAPCVEASLAVCLTSEVLILVQGHLVLDQVLALKELLLEVRKMWNKIQEANT